jgi:hypothetical protein
LAGYKRRLAEVAYDRWLVAIAALVIISLGPPVNSLFDSLILRAPAGFWLFNVARKCVAESAD